MSLTAEEDINNIEDIKLCEQTLEKEVKHKTNEHTNGYINKNCPKMKVKVSALFRNTSGFLNSFQQFIKKEPEEEVTSLSTTNTSDNSTPATGLHRYKRKKSGTQIMAKKRVNKLRGISVKNKRNQKKPIIVKNLTKSEPFLDFVNKKYNPIKDGVPFVQDRDCNRLLKDFDSSDLNKCLDCYEDKKSKSQTCRFYQYRTLQKSGNKLSVLALAEERNATPEDSKIWLPSLPKQSDLDFKTAIYLLIFVGQQFCKIYGSERSIANRYVSVTWKKPVKGIRELCDVCETTIFNTHYVCFKCGFAVCVDCFNQRQSQPSVQTHSNRKNYDDFGWILCTDKQMHDINGFHLAIFITQAVFGSVNMLYHTIRNDMKILGLCCDQLLPEINVDMRIEASTLDIRSRYPEVPREWLCDNRLLILKDPKCVSNLKLFQMNWLKGHPVIIEKVNESLDPKLWTPNSFNMNFGRQTSRLVDCMNGNILPKQPMNNFWDGFEDIEKRLVNDDTGEEMILKLKDWPPNAEFRDKLPIWFDNLMDALPLQEYTRFNGNRNLASRLPDFFVRPDLGPKMYCAYGSVMHPDKGTTNLHLDMSDAVNVMIYVGVARKGTELLESHLNGANDSLLRAGCDQQMMDRANRAGLKVGALWHIWKAEDADNIRIFLNKVAKERNLKIESNNDPIHDQSWYLDENLRKRLEEEYNVKGFAIAQCLGDAILVPAGAPHQVQNIHSCIKVAGEFVSPENVAHCLTMTQQFRNLSKRHNNHQDKLQIKNIIYHTIKDCLAILLTNYPTNPFNQHKNESIKVKTEFNDNFEENESHNKKSNTSHINISNKESNILLSCKGLTSLKKIKPYFEMEVIDGKKTFKCRYRQKNGTICLHRSRSRTLIAQHINLGHFGIKFKCMKPYCDKVFKSPHTYREHQKNHTCGFGLHGYGSHGVLGVCRNENLNKYRGRIIENGKKVYLCSYMVKGSQCGFTSRYHMAIKRHIHGHTCPYRKNLKLNKEVIPLMKSDFTSNEAEMDSMTLDSFIKTIEMSANSPQTSILGQLLEPKIELTELNEPLSLPSGSEVMSMNSPLLNGLSPPPLLTPYNYFENFSLTLNDRNIFPMESTTI